MLVTGKNHAWPKSGEEPIANSVTLYTTYRTWTCSTSISERKWSRCSPSFQVGSHFSTSPASMSDLLDDYFFLRHVIHQQFCCCLSPLCHHLSELILFESTIPSWYGLPYNFATLPHGPVRCDQWQLGLSAVTHFQDCFGCSSDVGFDKYYSLCPAGLLWQSKSQTRDVRGPGCLQMPSLMPVLATQIDYPPPSAQTHNHSTSCYTVRCCLLMPSIQKCTLLVDSGRVWREYSSTVHNTLSMYWVVGQ